MGIGLLSDFLLLHYVFQVLDEVCSKSSWTDFEMSLPVVGIEQKYMLAGFSNIFKSINERRKICKIVTMATLGSHQ